MSHAPVVDTALLHTVESRSPRASARSHGAPWRRTLFATVAAAAMWGASAQAEPTLVIYESQGSFEVLDSATGLARWSGQISGFTDALGQPLPLTSIVSFSYDTATLQLSGQFSFSSLDGLSTLYGSVSGSGESAEVFDQGGQLEIDYTVEGGGGALGGFSGFGLSFVQLTPGAVSQRAQDAAALAGSSGQFAETGLFVLDAAVPEPASFGLAGLALLGLTGVRRRRGG